MNNEISVIVADDHPIIRQAVCMVLNSAKNIKVVGEAENGRQAIDLVGRVKPSIAIIDMQMPEIDGFEAAKIILRENKGTSVIFLTMFKEPDLIRRVFELGVKGYILKESAVLDIVKCVEEVAEGNLYFSPQVSQVLLQGKSKEREDSTLTPAERNILIMIGKGKSSDDIAKEMFIARKTVENHRSNICKKLGITGNNALVKYALRLSAEGN